MDKMRISALIVFFMFAGSGLAVAQTGSSVILVSDNEADHAVAEAVENVKGIKVVVTPWGGFNQSVVDQIQGLNPEEVLIIGGPAAVPSAYETALLEFTNTVRVAGKDRYATSARVLNLFREDFKGKGAVLAYGYDKKGIEKALKKAKAQGIIVVFADTDGVPWEVQKALEKANVSSLEVEESPNMNTMEIKDDVDDDVGEVSFAGVDASIRASEQIQDAKKEISEAEEKIAELNVTATAPLRLLDNARERLKQAEDAFDEGKYGEAFGSAVASEHLAENAKDIAEDVTEYEEESREELKELDEKVAEKIGDLREDIVELEEKVLKAEGKGVDVSDVRGYLEEATLTLDEAEAALDQGDISIAVAKLSYAKNLRALAKVSLEGSEESSEEDEEKELEIEVEIEDGIAKVEVEINDDKMKFVLNTVDRAEIIAEIASRTALTMAEIEGVIEFEGNHAELGEQKIEKEEEKESEEQEGEEKEDEEEDEEHEEQEEGSSSSIGEAEKAGGGGEEGRR